MASKVKPAEGVAQTVIDNEVEGEAKTVTLKSPWGSKVNVSADLADEFKASGFTASK